MITPRNPPGESPEDDPTGVRALLSSLPEPDPMPAYLVERISASLAAEQASRSRAGASTVSPLVHRHRSARQARARSRRGGRRSGGGGPGRHRPAAGVEPVRRQRDRLDGDGRALDDARPGRRPADPGAGWHRGGHRDATHAHPDDLDPLHRGGVRGPGRRAGLHPRPAGAAPHRRDTVGRPDRDADRPGQLPARPGRRARSTRSPPTSGSTRASPPPSSSPSPGRRAPPTPSGGRARPATRPCCTPACRVS